jgi:hypothetical protein
MAGEVLSARSAFAAYEAEHDGVLAKIKSAAGRKGAAEDADLHDLKFRLQQLEGAPPRTPLIPSLFHEDVTPEALAQSIASGWPSSSLWSDEAGLVIGAHGMSDVAPSHSRLSSARNLMTLSLDARLRALLDIPLSTEGDDLALIPPSRRRLSLSLLGANC